MTAETAPGTPADRRPVYRTEEAAARRVRSLRNAGHWPGIVRCAGGWRLTHDPDYAERPHRATDTGAG